MNPFKKLLKQTAIYGLSSIVARLLNYLLVPIYTRYLVTSEYGIVTDLYAYVSFLAVFLTYGMETTFFKFSQDIEKKEFVLGNSIICIAFTTSIFLFLTFIFLKPISYQLGYSKHTEYILWFALIIASDTLTAIPFAKLRLDNKPLKFVAIRIFNILLNILLNLYFIVLCPYLENYYPNAIFLQIYSSKIGLGYIFISNLISSIVTLIIFIPDFFKYKLRFHFSILRQMLNYSYPLLIVGLAGMINETLDRIIIKNLVTIPKNEKFPELYKLSQVGIYGANYKLSILMTMFIQTFRYAAEPFYFSYHKEKNAKQVYADIMNYFVIVGLIIFLGVMMYMDIIKYFIDKSYHSGLKVVPILLLANLFLGIYVNLSIWFKLNSKTKYGAFITIIGALITIILNILLVPRIGYLGAAWATFLCYLSMMIICYLTGQKHYPINYNLNKFFFYTIFCMILYVFSLFNTSKLLYSKLLINSLLFFFFVFIVIYKENLYPFIKSLVKKQTLRFK